MKNYKFYLYTAVSFVLFFVLVSIISIPYLLKINGSVLLDNNISYAKTQVKHTLIDLNDSKISIKIDSIENRLKTDINVSEFQRGSEIEKIKKDLIATKLQYLVENTESELVFLSVFDWQGKMKCHPDRTKLDLNEDAEASDALAIENSVSGAELYDAIYDNKYTKSSKAVSYTHLTLPTKA